MGCGPGAPIPYQLSLAHFASANLAQRTLDPVIAKLHLQLTVNCLVGRHNKAFRAQEGKYFKQHTADTEHGDLIQGIGQGAVPDLKTLHKKLNGNPDNQASQIQNGEKWDDNMAFALDIAELAVKVADIGLKKEGIGDIQRSARMVSSLLQSALEGCLP